MAPLTLYYFDSLRRGETARLLLTIGGVEFVVSEEAQHTLLQHAVRPTVHAAQPEH
jgi:hypothetical protein